MAARKQRATLASQTIQPEEEIAEELEVDEDGTVSEAVAKTEGAINAEAAQSNRRRGQIIARKRGGEKHVPWNEASACLLYDDVTQLWPANTLAIYVTRLTGTPASIYIYGKPRNGVELYAAIKNQFHGRRDETEYHVAIRDEATKFDRGRGRVTIPSTLDEAVPAGPQPQPFSPPPQPQNPWVAAQQAQGMSGYAQPMGAIAPPPMQPADPMQLVLQRLSEMQARIDALSYAPAPQGMGAPPGVQPTQQPGVFHVPGLGYVQAVAPAPTQAPPVASQAPPAAALTPAQQFQQATELVSGAVSAATRMASLLPAPVAPAAIAAVAPEADEGPTRTVDLGKLKIIQNSNDGSLRPVETILANSEHIMGWVSEQREAYQAHQARMQAMALGQPAPPAAAPAAAPSQSMPAPNLPVPR